MSKPYVPGPYDEFRGIIEIDCSEFLPPEIKAKLRIGKFLPVQPPPDGCDLVVDPDSPPATPDGGPTADT